MYEDFMLAESLPYLDFLRIIGRCEEKCYEIVDFDFINKKALARKRVVVEEMWEKPYYFIGFAITHGEEIEYVEIKTHYGTFCLYPHVLSGKIDFEDAKRFVEDMGEGTRMRLERFR